MSLGLHGPSGVDSAPIVISETSSAADVLEFVTDLATRIYKEEAGFPPRIDIKGLNGVLMGVISIPKETRDSISNGALTFVTGNESDDPNVQKAFNFLADARRFLAAYNQSRYDDAMRIESLRKSICDNAVIRAAGPDRLVQIAVNVDASANPEDLVALYFYLSEHDFSGTYPSIQRAINILADQDQDTLLQCAEDEISFDDIVAGFPELADKIRMFMSFLCQLNPTDFID